MARLQAGWRAMASIPRASVERDEGVAEAHRPRRRGRTDPRRTPGGGIKARQPGHGGDLGAHRGAALVELVSKSEDRESVQFLINLLSRFDFPKEHPIGVGAQ